MRHYKCIASYVKNLPVSKEEKWDGSFSKRRGALHLRGLEHQEVPGRCGQWAALAQGPGAEATPAPGRELTGDCQGPGRARQAFRRATALLSDPDQDSGPCFPGSDTTHHRERDHVKSLQVVYSLALTNEEPKWGFRWCWKKKIMRCFLQLENNGLLIPTQHQRSESAAVRWFCNWTFMIALFMTSKVGIVIPKSVSLSIYNVCTHVTIYIYSYDISSKSYTLTRCINKHHACNKYIPKIQYTNINIYLHNIN